jgi:hypothetical protein
MARRSNRSDGGGIGSKFGGVSGVVGAHSVNTCSMGDTGFYCVLSRLFSSVYMIVILIALVIAIIFGGRWVYKNYVKKGR